MLWAFLNGKALFIANKMKLRSFTIRHVAEHKEVSRMPKGLQET